MDPVFIWDLWYSEAYAISKFSSWKKPTRYNNKELMKNHFHLSLYSCLRAYIFHTGIFKSPEDSHQVNTAMDFGYVIWLTTLNSNGFIANIAHTRIYSMWLMHMRTYCTRKRTQYFVLRWFYYITRKILIIFNIVLLESMEYQLGHVSLPAIRTKLNG